MILIHLGSVGTLIVAFIAIGGFEVGAIQLGCKEPDERCLPIRHCPPVYNRVIKNEHMHNITFKKELHGQICQPIKRMDIKTHICCSKPHIECNLNGKPGACLLKKQCPILKTKSEQHLMRSVEKNLCYVHDAKNYFCCTDALCASLKLLCDQLPSTKHTSAFPNCVTSNGTAGFTVPKRICSDQARSAKETTDRVCCVPPKVDHLIPHRNAAKLAQTACGTIGSLNKIQNGTFAQRGEFPWMVKLVYKDQAVCSGTLIHPLYVLTARHCINERLDKVQLGIHDLQKKREIQEIKIKEMSIHYTYDVGLLELKNPATLEDFVRPICLPIYASLRMHLPQTVTISGWGFFNNTFMPTTLMKAITPVSMNEQECMNNDYYICVGGSKHLNHCNGDSGGPYQALSKFGEFSGGRYVQYGIISNGPASCSNPDLLSRGVLVGYVIDWILEHMQL